MLKPNNITRAIIDATVDRSLREIEEDPRRSIRKLTDMGRQFSRGRFLQEIYAIFQELLRNDESPYYAAIENLLRYTDRKALKDFGINLGYNSLTFGGKVIRETEAKKNFQIPWALILRIDPTLPGSTMPSEIESYITQGRPLGIYTYVIRCSGSLEYLDPLVRLFRTYRDCGFIFLLPDTELSPAQLALLKPCTNTMCLFPAFAPSCEANAEHMRRQKSWYGTYGYYNDADCEEWISGKRTSSFQKYRNSFAILIAEDGCSHETRQRMLQYVKHTRLQPADPFIIFDLYGDALQIDRIMSSESCYFELLENGDIHTQNGMITDYRHTISLEQIFSMALPSGKKSREKN
jgi:hypothetical protein